jgi:antitoxin component YwqK of YwqJK toxin-antitoxin module
MRKKIFLIITLSFLGACSSSKTIHHKGELSSIQLLDRNGFSETISLKDRLSNYRQIDFLTPQPYQKVVRVYGRVSEGKTRSKITTYHPNGHIWQYLEILNGRAHGEYKEWHSNGALKISAIVIEGTPDVSEMAQMSWLFDGICYAFDDEGHMIAEIPYSKGQLHGLSIYYYPSGQKMREIPYEKNDIQGQIHFYSESGNCLETIPYKNGLRDGTAVSYWSSDHLKSEEHYEAGRLLEARYFDKNKMLISHIEKGIGKQALFENDALKSFVEYRNGQVEGAIETFNQNGCLINLYHVTDGSKTGEEWSYYPSADGVLHPKLYLQWDQDTLQGICKTWYENGVLESQREFHNNKRHGLSFGWFQEGDLMLMEEYENDLLIKGSYFRKWEKIPISKIESGKGTATLFDKEGRFIRKINYEKGVPQNEP